MSQTVITARITDQSIQLVNTPLIASGSIGALQLQCEFDNAWTGYTKTAVFYRDKAQVYHVKMTDGKAAVPREVLVDEGTFFFGIMGVGENTRTTEVLRMTVTQGAITTATANSAEPTPDIYHQLMQAYALLETRFNNMVAMRGTGGVGIFDISDEYISGSIFTNGAGAEIWIRIEQMTLIAGGHHYSDYCIPPEYAPLADVELKSSNADINITVLADDSGGHDDWARILIENVGNSDLDGDMVIDGRAFYPMASVSIAELGDIRVGFDGKIHPTAGDAVRAQANTIIGNICPAFTEKGKVVRCEPVAGYPLQVKSYYGETVDGGGNYIPWDDLFVDLTILGKNIYNRNQYPLTAGRYVGSSGGLTGYSSSSNYAATEGFIPIAHLRGQYITLNHPPVEVGGSNPKMAFYTAADESTVIKEACTNTHTAKVPDNATFMRFSVPKIYADGSQIQIELGTLITAYEAYRTPETFEASLDTVTASDFYQGYLDWITGELYSTHDLIGGKLVEKAAPLKVHTRLGEDIRPTGSSIIYSSTGDTEVSGRINPGAMIDILNRKLDALSTAAAAVPMLAGGDDL